jgi:hypothetical protein
MPESGVTKHNYFLCQFINPACGHEGEHCDCYDTPSQKRTTLAKQRLIRLRANRNVNRASTSGNQESAVASDPAVTLRVRIQFNPYHGTTLDEVACAFRCDVAEVSVQLHDRHWLNGVGGIQHMDDLVKVSLGSRDASDALPLWRCELEVACTDMRMVAFLVQHCDRNEGAADGRCVQHSVQGELRLGASVWHSDD